MSLIKHVLLTLVLIPLTIVASSPQSSPLTVYAVLKGHLVNGTTIYGHIYDTKDTFLKQDQAIRTFTVIAEKEIIRVLLPNFQPGKYAMSVYQDQNKNNQLDTNFIGIPKEPVALSNNHRPRFGPPKYKKAMIHINENGQTVELTFQ